MVLPMAVLMLPVYAAARTITFDTGDGPGIEVDGDGYTVNSISLNEGDYSRNAPGFSGVPLGDSVDHSVNASDPWARLVLPWKAGAALTWMGCTFVKWYDENDHLKDAITALPTVMPFGSNLKVKTKWAFVGSL